QPYDLIFLGGGGSSTIAGVTTFLNTGALQLGDTGSDIFTFAGGVVATDPAALSLSGTIAATTGVITLGDLDTLVTVVGGATVGGASTGAITLADVQLAQAATLVLGTGIANTVQVGSITGTTGSVGEQVTIDTTGTATVTGAVGTDIGGVTITNSGGTTFQSTVDAALITITDTTGAVTFQGVLTTGGLTTAANGYAVALLGNGSTITSATTFDNTGGVTLGDGDDTLTFPRGLTSTAGTTTLAGTLITDSPAADIGAPSRFGDLTLAADTVIAAGSGDVFFDGTVVGPWGLDVTAATITATAGLGQSFNRLANLTFTGKSTLGGLIYTSGDQTYDGDVTIEGGISINTSFSTPATVRFTGLVDGDGVGFGDSLEFTLYGGTLAFDAAIGSQQPLASITVQSAANVALAANATTTGQQSYNAGNLSLNGTYTTTNASFTTAFSPATATTLTGDTTIATGSGNVSLGNVAGDVADTRSLTITSTGTSSLAGSGRRLASLSVTGGEARVGGMATSGSQTYGGNLRATNPSFLGNPVFSTAAGGLSVAGATVLAANGTVSFDIQGGQLSFTGPVDNNDNPIPVSDLAINASADVVFGGAVGATRPILNLSVTTPGNLSLAGNVTTWPGTGPWGVQTYAAKVVLAGDATLSGLSASFSEGLVGNGHDLSLDFENTVAIAGGFTGLGTLASLGAATLAGAITTAGAQIYTGPVELAAATTLTAGDAVNFQGTVDGAHALNVANASNVNFDGDVGGTTPLADLTVNAPTGSIDSVGVAITAGGLAFHSADQLVEAIQTTGAVNGSLGTGNLTLNATDTLFAFGNLTATRNLATGTGNAVFAVAGSQLDARADNGSVTFGGNTTVGGFNGGVAVNATAGNITFGGALNECGSTGVFLGTSGDILFRGEVRDLDLLVIFGGANVTAEAAVSGVGLFGQVGGTGMTALADVSTISGLLFQTGTVNLTGSNYTTSGGNVTIEASVAIGTGGSVGPVGAPGILAPSQLVTIQTFGGNVTISGGTDGIYAARPQIVPNLVAPSFIIGSDTSLAIDAGAGEISLGGFAGFGSGGLLGLPLLDVTLAGSRILMPAESNLIAGTFSVTEGMIKGSGTVGNLAFDPATTLLVGIGSLDPVTGYEQFTVDPFGTVVLDSAALSVSANIPVPLGTILTLIDNQGSSPVSGTFAGLPEGATIADSRGVFKISYVGGDGNDVTLEAIAGDIVVSVVDNRVVITLPSTGTTVSNLSTRYVPRGGRLVITVAADGPLTGGGTGVTVNDVADTVTVRLAELPGVSGIDVIGGGGTDLITIGPGGINLAA
ncbi:MAG: beta strand repeat-containing protein, partial [Planctomycetia bacterium]